METETKENIQGESNISGKKRRQPAEYSSVVREYQHKGGVLAALMVCPRNVKVEAQDEGEQIVLVVRKHVITNLPWIGLAVLMVILPAAFAVQPFWASFPVNFRLMTLVFWYLLALTIVLEGFLSWYFDLFVVTDERIIDVDFKSLIYKNITTTKIEKIQDVTYTVNGPIASLLDYGNVLVQTAGEVVAMQPQHTLPTMEIWSTPHPAKVAKLINEMMLEEEQEKIEGRVH